MMDLVSDRMPMELLKKIPAFVGMSGSLMMGTIRFDREIEDFRSFCMNRDVVAMCRRASTLSFSLLLFVLLYGKVEQRFYIWNERDIKINTWRKENRKMNIVLTCGPKLLAIETLLHSPCKRAVV